MMGAGGKTDEEWGVNSVSFVSDDDPVPFLPSQLEQSSNNSVSILVLRVFRFNWVKYCLFDITSFALV